MRTTKGYTIQDAVTVLLLLVLVTVIGYLYVNRIARNQLWQTTYPVRAKLSLTNLTCSQGSPQWMADVLRHQAIDNNAPSNQIAHITADGQIHHCENGYVDKYPLISQAVTADTRYRYASVTKLWTADAILSLVRQGKLSLDMPLGHILTQINQPKDPRINAITIRHLLLHQGGFDRYGVFANDMFGIGEDICPNHIDKMNGIELNFDPGSQSSYSNLGYCLLGEVVATQYQKSYKDSIIAQYQLDDTHLRFISNTAMTDEVFYNHVETGITGVGDIYTAFDYDGLASAAGLSGNAIDLAKQVKVMVGQPEPNILSATDIKSDTKPDSKHCELVKLPRTDDDKCYGYGTVRFRYATDAPDMYYRDGALPGLSSLVVIDQQGGVVALLSNGSAKGNMQGVRNLIAKNL